MIETAIILGVGSQQHQTQLTYNRPRAMLPVLGKPLIIRVMDLLRHAKIRHYIVVVGPEEGAVASYLNTQWAPNVTIEYELQSSNNGLHKTLRDIAKKHARPFMVAAYNSFVHPQFPERLLKHHIESSAPLILSGGNTTLSKSRSHYFATASEQIVTKISQEKSDAEMLVLNNLAVCGQEFIDYLASEPPVTGSFGKQFLDIAALYTKGGGATEIADTSWLLEIETDHDLLTLNKFLLTQELDTHILSELPGTVQIIPPVRIDPRVSVGQGAKLGPYVYLEAGCSIGANASVQSSMILQNAVVSAAENISNMIVASKNRISISE